MRGRPRTFEREELIDSALKQFRLKGYAGCSIADLTAASGCTAPTLYALFGSKEGLFKEALERYAQRAFGLRLESLTTGSADRNVLEAVMRATVEAATSSGAPRGCLILIGELSDMHSPAAKSITRLRAYFLETLKGFLAKAREGGNLGPCDIGALARFYFSVAQGIAAQAADGATREELDPLVDIALAAWPEPENEL